MAVIKKTSKAAAKKKVKKLPTCTATDMRKRPSRRRKCTPAPSKKVKPGVVASPTGPLAAPPATSPSIDSFPTPIPSRDTAPVVVPSPPVTDPATPAAPQPSASPTPEQVAPPAAPGTSAGGVPTYQGAFGLEQAHRLLHRAGFGPTPGQAEELAGLSVAAAVERLINPPVTTLAGPAPTGGFLVGGQFAPEDRYGHIHLAFLDRAVRSTDSLGERMTLVLHDWFAVSELDVDMKWVWQHLNLLRTSWRGSFRQTLMSVTTDPAMLVFLNGTTNSKQSPNENYARELMELYALGAERGAYVEQDVRELARALTGFRSTWTYEQLSHDFRYDAAFHDAGSKNLFAGTANARSGNLTWQDGVNAVVDHSLHASFVVLKLWSYFIPTAPSSATVAALEAVYRGSGERLDALVRAILLHPDLYEGPSMAKGPIAFTAGLMRARRHQMTSDMWSWLVGFAGQFVGRPPNVSGWNDRGWLNTATHGARWDIVRELLRPSSASMVTYANALAETPTQAVAAALDFWGNPPISASLLEALQRVASETWSPGQLGDIYWRRENFLANRQNALRQLVAAAPDSQVS